MRHPSNRIAARPILRAGLLALAAGWIVFAAATIASGEPSAELPVIRLAYPGLDCESCHRFVEFLYAEAFGRLGWRVQIVPLPGRRALIESNAGLLDGETGRLAGFDPENRFSNLIRVPEPIGSLDILVFSADPDLRVEGWESLVEMPFPVAYQRGDLFIEDRLSALLPEHRRLPADDLAHVHPLLVSGRAGLLVVTSDKIAGTLAETFEASGIRPVGNLETAEVHPYLHKRHADLVPRLARVLREMKADGAFDRILDDILLRNAIPNSEE